MKKRTVSMLLCLLTLFSVFAPAALAAENETTTPVDDPVDPAPYLYVSSIGIDLSIASSGRADCYCSVFVPDTTKTCKLTMKLQKRDIDSESDDDWSTVTSWNKTDTEYITLDKPYYVARGYTYRLLIGITLRNSAGNVCESTAAESDYIYFYSYSN